MLTPVDVEGVCHDVIFIICQVIAYVDEHLVKPHEGQQRLIKRLAQQPMQQQVQHLHTCRCVQSKWCSTATCMTSWEMHAAADAARAQLRRCAMPRQQHCCMAHGAMTRKAAKLPQAACPAAHAAPGAAPAVNWRPAA
jgi:hypothetical protein